MTAGISASLEVIDIYILYRCLNNVEIKMKTFKKCKNVTKNI